MKSSSFEIAPEQFQRHSLNRCQFPFLFMSLSLYLRKITSLSFRSRPLILQALLSWVALARLHIG